MSVIYIHVNQRPRSKGILDVILASFSEYKSRIRELEKILGKKPEWASHTPKRSWRRHSALLTQIHEMQQER